MWHDFAANRSEQCAEKSWLLIQGLLPYDCAKLYPNVLDENLTIASVIIPQ